MNQLPLPDALRDDWIGPLKGVRRPRTAGQPAASGGMAARLRDIQDQFARADFDQTRVDAIRQALNEGRFVVDSTAVADALLNSNLTNGKNT